MSYERQHGFTNLHATILVASCEKAHATDAAPPLLAHPRFSGLSSVLTAEHLLEPSIQCRLIRFQLTNRTTKAKSLPPHDHALTHHRPIADDLARPLDIIAEPHVAFVRASPLLFMPRMFHAANAREMGYCTCSTSPSSTVAAYSGRSGRGTAISIASKQKKGTRAQELRSAAAHSSIARAQCPPPWCWSTRRHRLRRPRLCRLLHQLPRRSRPPATCR